MEKTAKKSPEYHENIDLLLEKGCPQLDPLFLSQLHGDEKVSAMFLDELPLLVVAKEANSGRYLFWNQKMVELTGIPANKALGKTARDIFPAEQVSLTQSGDQQALQSAGPVFLDDWEWLAPNGETRILRVVKKAISLSGRDPLILAYSEDVTDGRDAEKQVTKERDLTRVVLDSVGHQIAVIDHEGVITHINKAWLDFGRNNGAASCSIAQGVNYLESCNCDMDADFAHKSCVPCKTVAGIRGVLNGEQSSFFIEYDCSSPEQQRFFRLEVTPLSGAMTGGAVLSHVDITQQKITEAFMRARHTRSENLISARTAELQLFENIFKSALEGITVTDAEGRITNVNQAFCDITGYSRDEVIGKNPRILKSDRHNDSFYQRMWQQLQDDSHWEGEIWNRRKNGEIYPEWLTINTMRTSGGQVTHFVAVFHDISHIKEKDQKIKQLAYEDPLTGLPNRTLMIDRLALAVEASKRNGHQIAVLHLDIDQFKGINDLYGYPSGDDVLCAFAKKLSENVRAGETLSHLGGDDFVLVSRFSDERKLTTFVERLIQTLRQPLHVRGGREIKLNICIGVATSGNNTDDPMLLLQNSDTALRLAKEGGRNNYRFFDKAISARLMQRLTIEREIYEALTGREFIIHYQPQVEIQTGKIVGVEALVRWQKHDGSVVRPDLFIPIAEEMDLITDIDMYVLEQACVDIHHIHQSGFPELELSVNLSASHFQDQHLADKIISILKKCHYDPARFGIELTETGMMFDLDKTKKVLGQLAEYGFKIGVDDFGTGYSSLAYLKKLPITALKIDRSFISELNTGANDRAIIAAILTMAKTLELTTIAEGVELESENRFLEEHGCDQIQGYYYSRPLPFSELSDLLVNWEPSDSATKTALAQ